MNRPRPRLCLLATLLAVASAARAEAPPPLGTPRPFVLAQRTDVHLANGATLTLVPLGSVPKATVMLVERTGGIDEGAKNGLADFVGDYLKEGAGVRDADALAAAAAGMGGELGVGTGSDQTSLTLDVLSDHAPEAIALLADLVRRPTLPPTAFERLRANAARNAAVQRSEPAGIAGDAYARALWGAHPYGRGLPSVADIAGYRYEDVRDYVTRQFGAARTHLYVAGRFDPAAVEAAARTAFGDWAAGPAPTVNPAHGSTTPRVILIDRPGAPQSTLIAGLPSVDPTQADYIPLTVATTLLGGGLLSRLGQELREAKGWTYGVSARLSPGLRAGSWAVSADVTTAHTADSLAAILRAIAKLRTEPPTAEELKLTQNYRAGTFVVSAAGRSGLLGQLAFLDLHGLPDAWLRDYAAQVYAVTPAQVTDVFARRIDPHAMTIVVLGDLARIEREVRRIPELSVPGVTFTRLPASGSGARSRPAH